jgi:hypothetical protein
LIILTNWLLVDLNSLIPMRRQAVVAGRVLTSKFANKNLQSVQVGKIGVSY